MKNEPLRAEFTGGRPPASSIGRDGLYRAQVSKVNRRLGNHLELGFIANPFRALKTRFIVGTSGARVGSHLLCRGLLNYGATVNEYLNHDQIVQACLRNGLPSLESYCEFAIRKYAVAGVFGVKGEANILAPLALAGELPQHASDWGFVYLWRVDIVKQAISQMKAQLTGAWSSLKQPSRELTDDDFDGPRIATLIDMIIRMSATWEDVFTVFEVEPLRLTYEELTDDPAAAAARTAAFIGLVGPPIVDAKAPLQMQANELSDLWAERFRRENADFCREREDRLAKLARG